MLSTDQLEKILHDSLQEWSEEEFMELGWAKKAAQRAAAAIVGQDSIDASPRAPSEPAGWFVHWGSRNGESGVQPHVDEASANRAAENMRMYRSSETTAEVVPVYYAPAPAAAPTLGITVPLCESFRAIGVDISEDDLRKFAGALYDRGLNVAQRTALTAPDKGGPDETPVAWRIRVRDGKMSGSLTYHIYTERLPYEPDADSKITVLGQPQPVYLARSVAETKE